MKIIINIIDSENIYVLVIIVMICFGVISWLYWRCKVIDRKWLILIRVIVWRDIEIKIVEIMKNVISIFWICLYLWFCWICVIIVMYNGWVKKLLFRLVIVRFCIRIFVVVGIDEVFCRVKIMVVFLKIVVKVSKLFRMYMVM